MYISTNMFDIKSINWSIKCCTTISSGGGENP